MTLTIKYRGNEPKQGRPSDAGYDLRSKQVRTIPPGDRTLIQTGTQIVIPEGWVGMVCSRSGLALKHGVSVLNAPGIVDPHYIGDVGVILHNAGTEPFTVQKGDRIAQLLFVKVEHPALTEVSTIEDTDRGADGYGSSGVQ